METDRQAWDAISVRQFNSGDGRAAQELLESGCCAMVALLIGSRLFVANCGTQMAILCRDGTDGLSALSLSDWHELLARSFGNFGRKMSGHQCTAMPTVQPQIEVPNAFGKHQIIRPITVGPQCTVPAVGITVGLATFPKGLSRESVCGRCRGQRHCQCRLRGTWPKASHKAKCQTLHPF